MYDNFIVRVQLSLSGRQNVNVYPDERVHMFFDEDIDLPL